MRELIQVNLVSVVVASVAAMGVGFAWYSNALFGKKWMKLTGRSEANMDKSGMMKTFGVTFLVTLVSAYILSMFIHYAGAYTIFNGAKTGLWAFLGFVLPTTLANHLFSKEPHELYVIVAGHHLVGLLLMGAILAAWY